MKNSFMLSLMTTALLLCGCQNAVKPQSVQASTTVVSAPTPPLNEINTEREIMLKMSVIDVELNHPGSQNIDWTSAIGSRVGGVRKIATSMSDDMSVVAVDKEYLESRLSKDLAQQGKLTTHTGTNVYTLEKMQTPLFASSASYDLVARECTKTQQPLRGKQIQNTLMVDTISRITSPTTITIHSKVSAVTQFRGGMDCELEQNWHSDGNALLSTTNLERGESMLVAAVVKHEAQSPKPKVVTVMIITPFIKQ